MSMVRKSRTAVGISPETLEPLLKEVTEQHHNYDQAVKKMLRAKPGTDAYDERLGEVWAEAEVLSTKAEHAKMAIDQYGESIPA